MAWVKRGLNSLRVHLKNMTESKKGPNIIQAGLEDLAKITGEDVEILAKKSLEESEKLKKSEDLAVKKARVIMHL